MAVHVCEGTGPGVAAGGGGAGLQRKDPKSFWREHQVIQKEPGIQMALGFFTSTLPEKQCSPNSEQESLPTYHSDVRIDCRHFWTCEILKAARPSPVRFLK